MEPHSYAKYALITVAVFAGLYAFQALVIPDPIKFDEEEKKDD